MTKEANMDENVVITDDIVKNPTGGGVEKSIEKKIIKDGNITIETKNIADSKKQIDTIVKQFNAYYDREELQNNDQVVSYSLTIRIPSQNFEKLIATLEKGKDKTSFKSVNARDVTSEFIDIKTRLENKKAYLAKYLDLLKRASSTKDILEIQNSIRQLQEEIESSEARLKYLNSQVELSTLELYLENKKDFVFQPEEQDSFIERVKKSLSAGWLSIIDFVLSLISLWPWILLVLVVSIWLSILYKNKKSKR